MATDHSGQHQQDQDQEQEREKQQQQAQQQPDEQPGVEPDRIDIDDEDAVEEWAKKLDASPDQIYEAVESVGDVAADVEMHLKGSRSTTNADRLDELDGADDDT